MNDKMSEKEVAAMIEKLEQAQEKMYEAWELIDEYCRESNDRNTEAYIADHLRVLINNEHSFLGNDRNLSEVIHELRYGEDAADEAHR